MKRRGLASGIAFNGDEFGGVLFPLMMPSLLPQVGWAWVVRILGFLLMVLCAVSIAFCRSRIPPRNGNATTWRDTLPNYRILLDETGAMGATTAGVLLPDLAYFIPIAYTPSYYIDRQDLSAEESILFGFQSGSNESLTPICLGQPCDTEDYGRYYASCFTVVVFGVLASLPIAGSLLSAAGATEKEKYWGAAVFTGLSYVAALLCFVWVRVKLKD